MRPSRSAICDQHGRHIPVTRASLGPRELGVEERPGKAPMPQRLEAIAERLARLVPLNHSPERFHEEKSELVALLRGCARDV